MQLGTATVGFTTRKGHVWLFTLRHCLFLGVNRSSTLYFWTVHKAPHPGITSPSLTERVV